MPLPPVVEPAAELSRDEINRYSRHLLIPDVGMEGQRRLKNARVLVIGAGGLGSPVLLYLAAAGVGTLGIVDFDRVEESNLQRQVIHQVDQVGVLKAESAKRAIDALNPLVCVETHTFRLEPDNAVELFSQYDLIVDGTDNFATRYLVNDACILAEKPYVWGSIFRFEGQVSVFWESAPNGMGLNYRDLYPEPPPPEFAPSCSEGGVLGILCASIGSVMATEAIKLITGIGDPLLGRLLTYDALAMHYHELPLRRDPQRTPVTELVDYEYFCGLGLAVQETSALPVPQLSVQTLSAKLAEGHRPLLIDVREPTEWDIVRIPQSCLRSRSSNLAKELVDEYGADAEMIIVCKSGQRSQAVAAELQALGVHKAHNLIGGVVAWVSEIDPALPSY